MGSMSTTTAISKAEYDDPNPNPNPNPNWKAEYDEFGINAAGKRHVTEIRPDDSAGFEWPHGGHAHYFLPMSFITDMETGDHPGPGEKAYPGLQDPAP